MNRKKLESFKERLLARKKELRDAMARVEQDGRSAQEGEVQDFGDRATMTYAKETLFQQDTQEHLLLTEVEEALRRVDEGSYGNCLECGDPIEEKRLDAVPWANFCMRCQERLEQQAKVET